MEQVINLFHISDSKSNKYNTPNNNSKNRYSHIKYKRNTNATYRIPIAGLILAIFLVLGGTVISCIKK
jgi:hypothetical protein